MPDAAQDIVSVARWNTNGRLRAKYLEYTPAEREANSRMRRPDLFIVGAAKCGTTALYRYLGDHPRIFMSPMKEPRYFADDLHRRVTELDEYLTLFSAATDDHLAVGEASPTYLNSEVALPRIREFSPTARIIVMIRNPVEMVYSYHAQQIVSSNEDERDFERAWRLQGIRRQGRRIPRHCESPRVLQYAEVGRLGSQLERVLEIFDGDRVLVVVFDDFAAATRRVYEEVLGFLDVPSDDRDEFERENPGQTLRIPLVSRFARRPPRLLIEPYMALKKRFAWGDLGFTSWLKTVNAKPAQRPPLPAAFRRELVEEFSPEVDTLERILDRDLSHWRR
jgi:hypothetical protein